MKLTDLFEAKLSGDKDEISTDVDAFMKICKIKKYDVKKRAVIVYGDADLSFQHFMRIPVQFKVVNGDFNIDSCTELENLEGCPEEIAGNFYCSGLSKLSSLKGAPKKINEWCVLNNNQSLTSFTDIHRHLNEIRGAFYSDTMVEGKALGFLKIKHLRSISLNRKLVKLEKIINKYLPEGDMFACQQELIDAGFGAYAQL